MNLILLSRSEVDPSNRAVLGGRRALHIIQVLKAGIRDRIRIGVEGGKAGFGTITAISGETVEVDVELTEDPPIPLPCTLVLALPRPIVLKRLLVHITTLGIKKLVLINSRRVEKSYWQSPALEPGNIRSQLVLGLEQAKDTILPQVILMPQWKRSFREDIQDIIKGSEAFLAEPEAKETFTGEHKRPVTLVIGPEGGFVTQEIEEFLAMGCRPVKLGIRILKVETAVTAFIARLL